MNKIENILTIAIVITFGIAILFAVLNFQKEGTIIPDLSNVNLVSEPNEFDLGNFGTVIRNNDGTYEMSSFTRNALARAGVSYPSIEFDNCIIMMEENKFKEDKIDWQSLSDCLLEEDSKKLLGLLYVQPDAPAHQQAILKCDRIEEFYPNLFELFEKHGDVSKDESKSCCVAITYHCENNHKDICDPMFGWLSDCLILEDIMKVGEDFGYTYTDEEIKDFFDIRNDKIIIGDYFEN